jgi:hypothetical protein
MGDSTIIRSVGRQLIDLLKAKLSGMHGLTVAEVTLESPSVLRSGNILSVFLYRVDIDDANRRSTPAPSPSETPAVRPPLALNLYYLVTPIAEQAEDAHLLLNAAMEILNDTPVVVQVESLATLPQRTLEIVFNPLSLDEITRLWLALVTPYRLAMSYVVKVR